MKEREKKKKEKGKNKLEGRTGGADIYTSKVVNWDHKTPAIICLDRQVRRPFHSAGWC